MVREERLELSHLAAPEPKSGVSTNSTTPAHISSFTSRGKMTRFNILRKDASE